MTEQLKFYREYGYRRDMESQIRDIGSGRSDSTATQAANQIKHLKSALKEMVSIVEIHSHATKNNFAWAELEEARVALIVSDVKCKCVAFDIDTETGREINLLWIEDERPEKIYEDLVDHYGDKRDSWRPVHG